MLKKTPWQKIIFLFVSLSFLFPRKSYAYLDLGSGSYFLQILLAGLFTASIVLKAFWRRLLSFLAGLFSKAKRHEKNSGK